MPGRRWYQVPIPKLPVPSMEILLTYESMLINNDIRFKLNRIMKVCVGIIFGKRREKNMAEDHECKKRGDDIASTRDDGSDDNCEEFWMYWNSHNMNDDNESDADDEGDEGNKRT
ncbi:hypothetical protein DAPPUDRAFT_323925 [Daphnia pulex]|uniref:Uncharacterized protein n=1 Tax=Daphnia pulex TaxID=6669 RepID=E9H079_DAPPU|nr:hypothetical protein DAPPUDRAFT_323925 [Daphnia pulex]|eukprot:EFX74752.1 hypothetical protein DAPPUDRAFT_323925 [Daphnia pulex]